MLNRGFWQKPRWTAVRLPRSGKGAVRRRLNQNIAVAIAEAGRDGEVTNHGMISSDLHSVEKLMRRMGHPGKERRVC
jgi:hypothetical protein